MQKQNTTTAPIDRFKELLTDRIEPRFSIDPAMDGETMRIEIEKLDGMTEGETVNKFFGAHVYDIIDCAIESGIKFTQIGCGSIWHIPSNPIKLREALAKLFAV